MSIITGAELLTDRERLLKALPGGEVLQGIMTTDRAEGALYVLSRYEDPQWWLPKSKDTGNHRDSHRKLDFTRISGEQLCAEAKLVIARSIWAENSLANATIRTRFENLVHWLNWLHGQGIRSHTQVTPLVALRYVQYVRGLTLPNKPGTPLSGTTKFYRLFAIELCWKGLRATASGFDHPWPDGSATALAGMKQDRKSKTEIIPDDVLKQLFQHAESLLRQADDLLAHRDAVAAYQPRSKLPNTQSTEKTRFLKTRGWDRGVAALKQTLTNLRDGCFVIILATTGIRAHELGQIHRGDWFSQVRDGERFYFLVSRSDKTHAGKTSWLCPKIAIEAVNVLERLSAPFQHGLEAALEATKEAEDLQEITRLRAISGAVGLTKSPPNHNNRLTRLSGASLDTTLKNFTKALGLDWKLSSHQFRRTFANYVVHHKLGDLRYLRDHFKHWSLDMTILYVMNEAQDLELYDEIYAAFDHKRQAIVGHWLEPDTLLSGGMAGHILQMRSRTEEVRTYKDRRAMVEAISELVYLRSTGIAWCTNDTGVDCAGGQCEGCEHGCIDDTHKPFWEGLYLQQIELRQIDDLTDSGLKTVKRTMERCIKVLTDLGVDINRLKEQLADAKAI